MKLKINTNVPWNNKFPIWFPLFNRTYSGLFHAGLSFMAAGQNPMCQHIGHCNCRFKCRPWAPLWGSGAMSLEALANSPIPSFQIVFPCIFWWHNLFHLGLFLPAWNLHGDFVSPPPYTEWHHKMASYVNIFFSNRDKCCWSQIN